MTIDFDLQSIQEARTLCQKALIAQQKLASFTQEQVDAIAKSIAEAGARENRRLAEMAVEETGFGIVEDKMVKNYMATEALCKFIKNLKTVGVIKEIPDKKMVEIAEPMGVIAAIIPSTNPTSTTIYKSMIAIKSRNSIVVSPHPSAQQCINESVRIIVEAAEKAGAPSGAISCMTKPTKEGTHELMRHPNIALILATGGSGIVKEAHSCGKPALGVGPGNVPAFIERSADIPKAVRDILAGKTFDNGTVCASEQAIVTETAISARVEEELKRQGAYFMTEAEIEAVGRVVVRSDGTVNPAVVGKSVQTIAQMASISAPPNSRALLARLEGVGREYPLSIEKLSPILAYYIESDWLTACHRCIEILQYGGIGHTLAIHSKNEQIIMEFALKKPVFRIVANTPATHGAIGATTGLDPAFTLACGTWGGSITTDNITPLHLLNIKRLAYGVREVDDLDYQPYCSTDTAHPEKETASIVAGANSESSLQGMSANDIDNIIRDFVKQRQEWSSNMA